MGTPTISPAPPLLPGLIWRAITRDDLTALVDLESACHLVDGGLAFMKEPAILTDRYFPVSPGDLVGALVEDGSLVACAAVHLVSEEDPSRVLIVGQVRPEWRNRGIGAYLMYWSGVQALGVCSTATARRCLQQISSESFTEAARRLYQGHGFKPAMEELVMHFEPRLPMPDRPVPPDVTVTSWHPGLSAQFFEAYETSFRERPGFPGWSAAEWISRSFEHEDFRPEWSLLACVGEAPVAFLTAEIGNPGGYVAQMGVIPKQRRRGLGSALLVEALSRMHEAGETAAQLTVNVNNPSAIETYRQLGFETVGRRARYERVVE